MDIREEGFDRLCSGGGLKKWEDTGKDDQEKINCFVD